MVTTARRLRLIGAVSAANALGAMTSPAPTVPRNDLRVSMMFSCKLRGTFQRQSIRSGIVLRGGKGTNDFFDSFHNGLLVTIL